jgi:cytochrome P450
MAGLPIPTVRGKPVVGSTIDFARDTIGALMDGWRENGDLFRVRVPMSLTIVVHPDHVRWMLQQNHRNYEPVDWVSDAWRMVVGDGLLASSGSHWLRQRRLEQPGFHRQRIAGFATTMTEAAAVTAKALQSSAHRGEPVDLKQVMTELTLDILAKCLFSAAWKRESAEIPPAVTTELEFMFKQLKMPIHIPLKVPTPANRRFLAAREKLDAIVYGLIRERRAERQRSEDLLQMLIDAQDEGDTMTDEQIRDEVMTLIFAGHETVSCGLVWSLYLLSLHAEAARKLHDEVDSVLSGRPPTVDDLPKLSYTWMVIREALRLYPPVWPIARAPIQDDAIGGYHVPAGSMMLVLPYLTHRHPDFWQNPEGFEPERFTPEAMSELPRFAYFPFSGGPRKCIGDYFAEMELQLVVATLAQHVTLHLLPGATTVPVPGITLRPRDPIPMKVVDRTRPASV